MNLKEVFKDYVSCSAFQKIDGELHVIGKYGQISIIDNKFDIWFIGINMQSLTATRINSMEKKLHNKGGLHKLNGEAWVQLGSVKEVLELLPCLGIKKKRVLSKEVKAKLRDRLRNARHNKNKV